MSLLPPARLFQNPVNFENLPGNIEFFTGLQLFNKLAGQINFFK
jgi:hypothetical protein